MSDKNMTKQAWGVLSGRTGLIVADSQLPVFWMKKIAQKYADRFPGSRVVKVTVSVVVED